MTQASWLRIRRYMRSAALVGASALTGCTPIGPELLPDAGLQSSFDGGTDAPVVDAATDAGAPRDDASPSRTRKSMPRSPVPTPCPARSRPWLGTMKPRRLTVRRDASRPCWPTIRRRRPPQRSCSTAVRPWRESPMTPGGMTAPVGSKSTPCIHPGRLAKVAWYSTATTSSCSAVLVLTPLRPRPISGVGTAPTGRKSRRCTRRRRCTARDAPSIRRPVNWSSSAAARRTQTSATKLGCSMAAIGSRASRRRPRRHRRRLAICFSSPTTAIASAS